MRAGAFSESRVIEILNRRFVPFYYNTGGPGQGRDEEAAAFVKGKVKNRWAHFSAWTPEGEYLGESDVYADKNQAFEFLTALLRARPEFDAMTPEEAAIASGGAGPAAALFEALGEYDRAVAAYERLGELREARLGRARIARYRKDWEGQEKALQGLERDAEVTLEHGYRLIAGKKYAEARALLEPAVSKHRESPRLAEFRFYAGVACWFLGEKDRANAHWCWVVENLPDDRMARRCYTAAAAEGMPYENPELGGYAMEGPYGSIPVIKAAYEKALKDYRKLGAGDFSAGR